jgi:hypothetical protein
LEDIEMKLSKRDTAFLADLDCTEADVMAQAPDVRMNALNERWPEKGVSAKKLKALVDEAIEATPDKYLDTLVFFIDSGKDDNERYGWHRTSYNSIYAYYVRPPTLKEAMVELRSKVKRVLKVGRKAA